MKEPYLPLLKKYAATTVSSPILPFAKEKTPFPA